MIPDVDGIPGSMPLPKHINDEHIINAIDPTKT
jgi:5,10-methylene-tetrahydrofolate dehydrogenase/methenyl tetrahydrofolate cyclohydrolase